MDREEMRKMLEVVKTMRTWSVDKPWVQAAPDKDSFDILVYEQLPVREAVKRIKLGILPLDLTDCPTALVEQMFESEFLILGNYIFAMNDYYTTMTAVNQDRWGYIQTYQLIYNTVLEVISAYMACWLVQANASVKRYYKPNLIDTIMSRLNWMDVSIRAYTDVVHATLVERKIDFESADKYLDEALRQTSNLRLFWQHISLLLVKTYTSEVKALVHDGLTLEYGRRHLDSRAKAMTFNLGFCINVQKGDLYHLMSYMCMIDSIRNVYM